MHSSLSESEEIVGMGSDMWEGEDAAIHLNITQDATEMTSAARFVYEGVICINDLYVCVCMFESKKNVAVCMFFCVSVCVCVCVRERGRHRHNWTHQNDFGLFNLSLYFCKCISFFWILRGHTKDLQCLYYCSILFNYKKPEKIWKKATTLPHVQTSTKLETNYPNYYQDLLFLYLLGLFQLHQITPLLKSRFSSLVT